MVGIEIVHYVRGYSANGSKLRWREELQDQVVRSAKQKFEAEFHTPLSVRFHWFHHRLLRGADVDSLANAISKFISTNEPLELDENMSITPDDREQISNFITRISVRRKSSSAVRGSWSNVECGPAEADETELRAIIASKDAKVASYLKHCSEVWLIVVADGRHISSSAELNEAVRMQSFKSRFKKLLYYEADSRSVSELRS